MEQIEKLINDVEELKRGQEEILGQILDLRLRIADEKQPQNEIFEFREMVRHGADPLAAFKDIQKRKGGK